MSRARTEALLALAAFALTLGAAGGVDAQSVRYSRPYSGGYGPSAYFDHRGGGGCTDWACGGVCYDGHTGNDFAMPVGTPVLAAAAGRVVSTYNGCANYGYRGNPCGGRCGNHVVVQHSDGSRSTYCHMQLGSIRVSTGASVSCGTRLGSSASSGSSTGPHLHFGHRSPGAGSSSDPFAGRCSRSTSLWASQGGYRGYPGASCAATCSRSAESCNGRDDDCDGRTDEGLSRRCGTDVGECRAGTSTCSRGSWGGCAGSISPRAEDCDGRDDDCDGRSDEDLRRSCGTDVGECVSGIETCRAGSWDACEGAIDPVPERCDGLDNDCDGEDDDERVCEREEVAWGAAIHASGTDSDVDGDGRADACARTSGGFSCLASGPHGFARLVGGAPLMADDFWISSQIRMGDLDGDGRSDVCGREGDQLVCWGSAASVFDRRIPGPDVSGATSIELADVRGEGRLDVCVRDASGLRCHLTSSGGFGEVVRLDALSDAAGFGDVIHHGSLRFGDVDGDGRTDVCARSAEGVDCWLSAGDHFAERVRGPRWRDEDGFAELSRWSTLRLADVDGDGRADLCARLAEGFGCALSSGHAFGAVVLGPAMSGEEYARAEVYSTLRMADIDGDAGSDVCVREPDGITCWLFDGRAFSRAILGPALSDEEGWNAPARYRSIRLADVNADGRADLCARHAEGLRCSLSTGHGFDRTWIAPAWDDAESGLAHESGATTIRIGGGAAAAGRDGGLGGVFGFGCRAGPSRPSAWWLWAGLVALGLLVRRRRRRG